LYGALDWLKERQSRIEGKLAGRHLSEGALALYDVSNSHYEGRTCPLAQIGKDKDGRHGASVIAYGVMTDREGRPVALEVYPGDTGDPTTVPDQVVKLRARFGLSQVVLVGDRGMLTTAKIDYVKQHPGLGWISALRSDAIRKLVDGEALQLSLFDQVNLAEIRSPDFPGERLVACFNPLLADERKRKRGELLDETEALLTKVAAEVASRTKKPMTAGEIGQKVGRVMYRHKVAKHFDVEIADSRLTWTRNEESIRREAELDGFYVIRTSEPAERLSAEDAVRSYKRLAQVEQAFRCMKGIDLRVRPVFLRDEDHVRAHFFLCMLAYYVEWHMRRALAPILFEDEAVSADRDTRDPVARPETSASVKAKKKHRVTPDGLPVHSFGTLLADLATQACVTYRVGSSDATFEQISRPSPLHQRAFDLLGV
jgi:transposase